MAVVPTVQIGNKVLKTVCTPVDFPIDDPTQALISNLVDSMRDAGLIGMAACQIGETKRIMVMELRSNPDTGREEESELYVCVNPVVVSTSKENSTIFEGCGSLSRGTLFGRVTRPKHITLRYQDQNGEFREKELSGLLSHVAQHEIDHLDGTIFIDRMEDPTDLYDLEEYKKIREQESQEKQPQQEQA